VFLFLAETSTRDVAPSVRPRPRAALSSVRTRSAWRRAYRLVDRDDHRTFAALGLMDSPRRLRHHAVPRLRRLGEPHTISVTLAPRRAIAVNAAGPGVS